VLVLNVVGAFAAKAVFRQAVREVLIEERLIHAQQLPTDDGVAQVGR